MKSNTGANAQDNVENARPMYQAGCVAEHIPNRKIGLECLGRVMCNTCTLL